MPRLRILHKSLIRVEDYNILFRSENKFSSTNIHELFYGEFTQDVLIGKLHQIDENVLIDNTNIS